jgi:hypothetical protein
MLQDIKKYEYLLYFTIDKECHSSRGTQFYCIGKHLFSKIPIHCSETRWYVNTALESAIMNVHNIQEGKDLNYISILVLTQFQSFDKLSQIPSSMGNTSVTTK